MIFGKTAQMGRFLLFSGEIGKIRLAINKGLPDISAKASGDRRRDKK